MFIKCISIDSDTHSTSCLSLDVTQASGVSKKKPPAPGSFLYLYIFLHLLHMFLYMFFLFFVQFFLCIFDIRQIPNKRGAPQAPPIYYLSGRFFACRFGKPTLTFSIFRTDFPTEKQQAPLKNQSLDDFWGLLTSS